MVHVELESRRRFAATNERVVLRKEKIPGLVNRSGGTVRDDPILAAAEINGHFVVMFADRISVFSSAGDGWTESNTFAMYSKLARDPRGILITRSRRWNVHGLCAGNSVQRELFPALERRESRQWMDRAMPRERRSLAGVPERGCEQRSGAEGFLQHGARFLYRSCYAEYRCGSAAVLCGRNDSASGGWGGVLLAGVDGKVQIVENG